ncbi:hypothetical protein JCM33374_g1996 [Metschnikowia sp. JCM 33374]|nr:hypothetical protein JCM33374_g1996 [Metschnikowia sp. JCM 33374]
MNSRDILDGFFADAAFSDVCTREKFARECASSLSVEIASRLYDLVAEQHEKTVQSVRKNVGDGDYLPETHELENPLESAGGGGFQSGLNGDHTSIPALVQCLTEAVKTGEAQGEILSGHIDAQLQHAERQKTVLRKLMDGFRLPEIEAQSGSGPSTKEVADKCISVLQEDSKREP